MHDWLVSYFKTPAHSLGMQAAAVCPIYLPYAPRDAPHTYQGQRAFANSCQLSYLLEIIICNLDREGSQRLQRKGDREDPL
jgi:hypothetical protein